MGKAFSFSPPLFGHFPMKSSLVFDKMNAISDTTSIIKLLVCLYRMNFDFLSLKGGMSERYSSQNKNYEKCKQMKLGWYTYY